MKSIHLVAAAAMLCAGASAASAAAFTNGGFETGSYSGWVQGAGYRGNTPNSGLTTAMLLPGGSLYDASYLNHSTVVGSSYVDPNLGAALGSTVYSLDFSARVEDTTNGGYASVISQTVANYTDPDIFFAWKAVLENGGHVADESAEMLIELTDNTTNQIVIRRQFNAGASGTGVDSRFSSNAGGFFYTPQWQIEQLSLTPNQIGDTFTLSVLGADCEPTGHTGYVYLDGFGAVAPPTDGGDGGNGGTAVPEPASLMALAAGLTGLGLFRRKRA